MSKDLKLKDQGPVYHQWAYKYLHVPIQQIINQKHNEALHMHVAE